MIVITHRQFIGTWHNLNNWEDVLFKHSVPVVHSEAIDQVQQYHMNLGPQKVTKFPSWLWFIIHLSEPGH